MNTSKKKDPRCWMRWSLSGSISPKEHVVTIYGRDTLNTATLDVHRQSVDTRPRIGGIRIPYGLFYSPERGY